MFKKSTYFLFSFLFLLFSSKAIYANYCQKLRDWHEIHPYIGITGGATSLGGSYKTINTLTGTSNSSTFGNCNTSGLVGGVAGIQVVLCNDLFLALQGNALYNSLSKQARYILPMQGISDNQVRIQNHFQSGIDGRIGFAIGTITPYVLGGVEVGRWTLKLTNPTTTSSRGVPANSTLGFARTIWGPKVGGGVTFPVACSISANVEYSYTWFGHISTNLLDIPTGTLWNHRETIRQNALTIGFNYLY